MRTAKVVRGLCIGLVAGSLILSAGTSYAQDEVQELKEQVTNQQKQIQELRKALDEEGQLLNAVLAKIEAQPAHTSELKPTDGVEVASTVPMAPSHAPEAATALPGAAGDSQAVSASSEVSSHTSQGEAQHILLASSASPSATSSATNPAQSGGSASQAPAPKVELPAALKAFHPIGLFYISYQAGTQYSGVPDETTNFNSFQLKRGYFGADVDITSYLTGRFVSDITVESTGDVKLRAKYMYGKFHWKGNEAISSPYMEFGLAHMPWLDFEEAINGFRMQDTMFLERNGIFNSADVGVMVGSDFGGSMSSDFKSKVNSHYAGRYGSWQVGVYNGGGYHATEQNTNKVFEGRVTIRPVPGGVPGLQFTAFGIVGKGNKATDPPDWRVFNGMVSYESQFFTFTGQGFVGKGNQGGTAINSDGTGAEQRGFSVFAAVHIPTPKAGGKISILGRADEMNTNTDVYNDIKRLYIAGVAWHFYKSNIWLFDFQRTNHSISTIPGENRAQVTLQLGF
jgi:hypothetical protein